MSLYWLVNKSPNSETLLTLKYKTEKIFVKFTLRSNANTDIFSQKLVDIDKPTNNMVTPYILTPNFDIHPPFQQWSPF